LGRRRECNVKIAFGDQRGGEEIWLILVKQIVAGVSSLVYVRIDWKFGLSYADFPA
jgi:hypothetical protein